MSDAIAFSTTIDNTDVSPSDYVPIGVATCFVKEDGEVKQITVLEPIPTSALEILIAGVATSYQRAYGMTIGEIIDGTEGKRSPAFPIDAIFCENFAFRAISAARTFQRKPELCQSIPVGTVYDRFNYSTERKRVLNAQNVVKTDDNVKQHAYTHQVL
ncbi:MAG: hypothetical protein HC857_11155 [Synechococcales cyanobacterium RU_4_20]|nr:hypothetical protein [Synechococcales cyanobacterium RU_4_20]NJR69716.1 hypothetical protein [Synechococcales cyanobacterium CRU_2_2]